MVSFPLLVLPVALLPPSALLPPPGVLLADTLLKFLATPQPTSALSADLALTPQQEMLPAPNALREVPWMLLAALQFSNARHARQENSPLLVLLTAALALQTTSSQRLAPVHAKLALLDGLLMFMAPPNA